MGTITNAAWKSIRDGAGKLAWRAEDQAMLEQLREDPRHEVHVGPIVTDSGPGNTGSPAAITGSPAGVTGNVRRVTEKCDKPQA